MAFDGLPVQIPGPVSFGSVSPLISPDRRYVAYETVMQPVNWFGEGQTDGWPAVVVADLRTGEPLFRVRSAALYYPGAGISGRWLASSDGICVQADRQLGPRENVPGYAICWFPAGTRPTLELLPAVEPQNEAERTIDPHGQYLAAEPSPDDPNLIALGKSSVLHRSSGRIVSARLPQRSTPAEVSPWAARPGEVAFMLPAPRQSQRGPWPFLSARIEYPPFDDTLRFITKSVSPLSLQVHELPDPRASVVGALEPGDRAVLSRRRDGEPIDPYVPHDSTTERSPASAGTSQIFAHIESASGIRGWVDIDSLDWAP